MNNNDNPFEINHFNNADEILTFLRKNPMWLSGFTCGEGCFTGYLSLDKKSLWGLQPGLDFNITQSTRDVLLLEAINAFFEHKGGVYNKPNNVSVVAFRNVKVLKENIAPFFQNYPLLGIKSYEFERWLKLLDIFYNKKHLGKHINTKSFILDFAEICKNWNKNRINNIKQNRIDIIIDWLKKLDTYPSEEEKLILIELVKSNSIKNIPS
jgi:hypothetical protein